MNWQPSASLATLKARAELLDSVRAFFRGHNVLEVETPILNQAGDTAVQIQLFSTQFTGPDFAKGRRLYLQSSPELFMKRLLSANSGPIYQIAKVFRDGEKGQKHAPEFTLLEWYRPGFDHHRLMNEVADLTRLCLNRPDLAVQKIGYQQLFQDFLGVDPLETNVAELQNIAIQQQIPSARDLNLDQDAWLDLLITQIIEPQLPKEQLTFIIDYPQSQAALARVNTKDPRTAYRFEAYFDGFELANGYWELADANEQTLRFEQDNHSRKRLGLPEIPIDKAFLAALEQGLPDCAGVALGLDRLLMAKLGIKNIQEVMAFGFR